MLTATMLFTGTAFADEAVKINDTVISAPVATNFNLSGVLTLTEIGEGYIIGTTDAGEKLQLNISDATVMLDSETGAAIGLSDLKEGDEISATYSPEMTKSIPAQTSAALIAVNTDKGGNVNLIDASSVSKNEDGSLTVTDEGKNIVLTISKDASVTPYKTRNIVRLDDIAEGTRLIAWYDMVTMSIPAQASTQKAVLLPELYSDEEAEDIDPDFTVSDTLPYSDGITLAPEKKITRAEFAHITYNMLSSVKPFDENIKGAHFTDIDKKEVNTLAAVGIVAGKGEGLFAPEDLITREEAAVLLDRTAKYLGIDMSMAKIATGYSDIETVSPWALSAVQNLSASGIISSEGGAFNPKNDITAADASQMLCSMSDVFTERK